LCPSVQSTPFGSWPS